MNKNRNGHRRLSLKARKARRILERDIQALARKVEDGRPLSRYEVRRVEAVAGKEHGGTANDTQTGFAGSRQELADRLGVSLSSITRHLRQSGCPRAASDGRYNVGAWRRYLIETGRLQPEANGAATMSPKAQAELQLLQARERQLSMRLEVEKKQFIAVGDVERMGKELGVAIRLKVQTLHRLALNLAGLSAVEIEAQLKAFEDEILRELWRIAPQAPAGGVGNGTPEVS